ncbi:myosin-6 [Lactuca sativa]|uniref:myosin-6 n=1 Tax=Lactuca sativa TaxID=4236 RepID=UPI0022AFE1E2|nr:myosin-6 [Lactuca sativa]
MYSSQVNLQSCLIPLEEIIRATKDFSREELIGSGGYGMVYKGQLSELWQNRTVAIKRLDHAGYQGESEFINELQMVSRLHHENIISFVGYCNDDNEMIIVHDYASNGSLDYHLQDPNKRRGIKWTQRLKICLGAARGLDYLHSGLEEPSRVIHRDVKSANILLDENFVAKICDFGLSKVGPTNLPNTQLYTKVAGTTFYLDPRYRESGILTKESDVYSFGVVMFEMLSGMLVYLPRNIGDDRAQSLMNFVRRYEQNDENKLIDNDIRDQIDTGSFNMFKEIAYQCVSFNFKDRPMMGTIVEKIEEALDIQENVDNVDALIECVRKDIGFSHGKPVAAFTIYKCLLHLKYLEAERTSVFDRLIHIFNSAIEDEYNTTHMAYWLSNTSTLLFLIQKSLKFDSASPPTSQLQRAMGFPSSVSDLNEIVQQVEAKQLTLHFKRQLTECAQKMYGIIRDKLKHEVGLLLDLCIQANFIQASFVQPTSVPYSLQESVKFKVPQRLFILGGFERNHWHGIVGHLTTFLNTLKENYVPPTIVKKIFAQTFSYINVQLFNSLLLYRDCCTSNNGKYVKAGLAELELWCLQAKEKYAGSAWDKLKHIRQASDLLAVYENNPVLIFIYPTLSKEQVNRIQTHICDMRLETRLSAEILALSSHINLPHLVSGEAEDSYIEDISVLLEDNSSKRFCVDDLFASLQVKDFANIKPAGELAKYKSLDFLYK